MWGYICVLVFPHHLCGNGIHGSISAFCAGFSDHCQAFTSLFHHLQYVPSSLNVFIKDLHWKTTPMGLQQTFILSALRKEKHINPARCNLWYWTNGAKCF